MIKIEICPVQLEQLLKVNSISNTAKILGVNRDVIVRRIKKLGIIIDNEINPKVKHLPDELTQEQKDAIIGTLLGDGSIYLQKGKTSACYKFGQCLQRIEYVEYLNKLLKPFSHEIKKDGNKFYFYTSFCNLFLELRQKWYPDGKKIVPDFEINNRILYFWFMDDGCNQPSNKSAYLYTNGFQKEESQLLCDKLKYDFSIKSNIVKKTEKDYGIYYYIRINSESYFDFMDIVISGGPQFGCFDYKFIKYADRKKYNPILSEITISKIIGLYGQGFKVQNIANILGLSLATTERVIYYKPEAKTARDKFKKNKRQIIINLSKEGKTQREIGEIMNCSSSTICNTLNSENLV